MTASDQKLKETSRRNFLKGITAAPAVALATGSPLLAQASNKPETQSAHTTSGRLSKKPGVFVGMQIGARSFVDEGVEKCLDTLQETGGVNVLFATVFTYGTGLAGRQVHTEPLPDHGAQEYDRVHGGSFTKVHPEFYADSVIKDIRAPELGEFDILADVIPKAKARGMQIYCLFEEAYNPRLIPNFEKIAEVDVYGKVGTDTCFNNPYARIFLTSMVKDWLTNNDVDGLMWESERQGPLNETLQAHFGRIDNQRFISCFCEHCVRKG